MAKTQPAPCPPAAAVIGLIPMAHVADVDRSLKFYSLLGFEKGDSLSTHDGRTAWAMARRRNAAIMFALADAPIVAPEQAVLFYLYTHDLAGLRAHLLGAGVVDRGEYQGCPTQPDGRGAVWSVSHPPYMPLGECRVEDPDGYTLLIGQLEASCGLPSA